MSKPDMEDVLVDLFESVLQADDDLCGEQRRWHLPRLQRVMRDLMVLFPMESGMALARATTPYGEHYEVTEVKTGLNIIIKKKI